MSTVAIRFNPDELVRVARRSAIGLLLFVSACVAVHCGFGCSPAHAPSDREQSYVAEIIACAAVSGFPNDYDKAFDDQCRAAVDCRYGVGPCPDSGTTSR